MVQTIQKYFYTIGYLELPNIGVLKIVKKPAYEENGQFYPSNEEVVLVAGMSDSIIKPSKQFYFFISEDLNISIENAIQAYEKFINVLFSSEEATLDLGSIGFIFKSTNGYQFKSKYIHSIYVDTLNIDKVDDSLRMQIPNDLVTSIPWWIWPLILSLLAILAIFLR